MPSLTDLSTTLALVLCALVLVGPETASALPQFTPATVVERINPSPACAQRVVVGTCWCGPVPCGWRVVQYVPTTFIETVRQPGETLLASFGTAMSTAAGAGGRPASGQLNGQTRQTHQNGRDSTFEAHIVSMPERLVQIRNGCTSCRLSTAQVPATPSPDSLPGSTCGDTSIIGQGVTDIASGQSTTAGISMPLHYASEVDALNWRTGCRDVAAQRVTGRPGASCDNGFDSRGSGAAMTPDSVNACIGRWGPLYPRQMRTRGPEERLSSAIATYRALSIARNDLGTYPYPVDTSGLLQQAYPAVSACLPVGSAPVLPPDVLRSPDGAYAWIYWRLTTCCIPFDIESNC